jgi:hypothetical protein
MNGGFFNTLSNEPLIKENFKQLLYNYYCKQSPCLFLLAVTTGLRPVHHFCRPVHLTSPSTTQDTAAGPVQQKTRPVQVIPRPVQVLYPLDFPVYYTGHGGWTSPTKN